MYTHTHTHAASTPGPGTVDMLAQLQLKHRHTSGRKSMCSWSIDFDAITFCYPNRHYSPYIYMYMYIKGCTCTLYMYMSLNVHVQASYMNTIHVHIPCIICPGVAIIIIIPNFKPLHFSSKACSHQYYHTATCTYTYTSAISRAVTYMCVVCVQ